MSTSSGRHEFSASCSGFMRYACQGKLEVWTVEAVLQFPIVIYPSEDAEGGQFTVHCLSMDLLADDDTVEGAVSDLLETIEAALEAAQKHNANVLREAPDEYWDKLRRAVPLPAELKERIIFSANKRLSGTRRRLVDVERQCDLRQLQPA